MKSLIWSLYDSKAKIYHKPFYSLNHETCLRDMTRLANDKQTDPGQNPEDFTLFQLGEYDDGDASIELLKAPEAQYNLAMCVKPANQTPDLKEISHG